MTAYSSSRMYLVLRKPHDAGRSPMISWHMETQTAHAMVAALTAEYIEYCRLVDVYHNIHFGDRQALTSEELLERNHKRAAWEYERAVALAALDAYAATMIDRGLRNVVGTRGDLMGTLADRHGGITRPPRPRFTYSVHAVCEDGSVCSCLHEDLLPISGSCPLHRADEFELERRWGLRTWPPLCRFNLTK